MKRTLLCLLLSAGLIFGNTTAFCAERSTSTDAIDAAVAAVVVPAQAVDTLAGVQPVDSLAVIAAPAPFVAEAKTDSLLQLLDQRLANVEQTADEMRGIAYRSRTQISGEVAVVLITILITTGVVLIVFFSLKYLYRRREKRYELERLCIERGERLSGDRVERGDPLLVEPWRELPVTVFVRRLLIVSIVAFSILAWVGVANLGYMRFFSSFLLWALIAGVGYVVVYLFRQYVQRRDDNR